MGAAVLSSTKLAAESTPKLPIKIVPRRQAGGSVIREARKVVAENSSYPQHGICYLSKIVVPSHYESVRTPQEGFFRVGAYLPLAVQ